MVTSTCRFCSQPIRESLYDASFRDLLTGEERLFFALPGSLCMSCKQFFVDTRLLGGHRGLHCTMAIESDPFATNHDVWLGALLHEGFHGPSGYGRAY